MHFIQSLERTLIEGQQNMEDRKCPKILVLTSTFPRWPGDREPPFVFELCRRLTPFFHVKILTPHAPGARRKEVMDGVEVERFRYFLGTNESLAYGGGILANLKESPWKYALVPFFLAGEFVFLTLALRSGKCNLVHAHWLFPQGFVAYLLRKITGWHIPLLCTSHGGDLFALRGPFFKFLKKRVLAEADGITVVSRVMKTEAESLGCHADKIQVIPMGVDLRETFVPAVTTRIRKQILFVGRLVEKKGLIYLLRAMPEVLNKHPDTRLVITGSGPEEGRLRSSVHALGLSDKVEFCGPVLNQKLPSLYQTSSMVVFPSIVASDGDREGFGLVQVEALGCECPVIATDLPAIRDIIADGETGLIVPQKDEQAIADKIIYLLDHPEEGKRLARNGRQFVLEHYDWAVIAERYRGFMQKLL
jgi:glycosyltransferase involved in cell wall biosynthesis